MPYIPQTWHDLPTTDTPITATRMGVMETGIQTGASNVLTPTATKTSAYTAVAGDLVICDTTSGGFTVTLPAAAPGVYVGVRKTDSGTNTVTINAAGTDTIGVVNTVTTVSLTLPGQVDVFVGMSSTWVTVSSRLTLGSLDSRFGIHPDIQTFNVGGSTTWTKPTNAGMVTVIAVGGGAGGGAGRRGAAGTVRCGGGGGSGAGVVITSIPASVLGSTEAVAVGAGGIGGAAQTVNDTNGANGNSGSVTTFGVRGAGFLVTSRVPTGGGGGSSTAGTGGTSTNTAGYQGGAGNSASVSGGAGSTVPPGSPGGCGAGGAGGGISSADAASAGGTGGAALSTMASATPAGGAIDTSGSAGFAPQSSAGRPGGGGSGGGSSITTVGGTGGAGGQYGGGGAGGGASLNGNNSGAGGAGADGVVVVISQ